MAIFAPGWKVWAIFAPGVPAWEDIALWAIAVLANALKSAEDIAVLVDVAGTVIEDVESLIWTCLELLKGRVNLIA